MLQLLSSVKLSKRIIFIVILGIVSISGTIFYNLVSDYKIEATNAMIEKAASFTAVADETKDHVAWMHSQKMFDEAKFEAEIRDVVENNGDYTKTKFFKTIPVVAGWTAAEEAAKRENIFFEIVSFNARNKKHEPTNDPEHGAFRSKLLADLDAQYEASGEMTIHRINEENNSLYYMRSVVLVEACMKCHGHPSTSPTGDGKDMLGFDMENWKVGDSHGAYEIRIPLEKMDAHVASIVTNNTIIFVLLLIGVSGIIFFLVRKTITTPLQQCVDFAAEIESGNLAVSLEIDQQDEIGELVGALNNMSSQLNVMFKDIINNTEELNRMSESLVDATEQANNNADGMAERSNSVATATEELSVSMNSVSTAAQNTSNSISMVATSTEEMTSTVSEIASNTTRAQSITQNAVQVVKNASSQVDTLGSSANEITEVIGVINEISEQTKLLALNATIEAARAGEAGKGFAVVANEVKELAKQTNDAIESIQFKINAMQISTTATIDEINKITDVINEVSDIVTGISTAIEEQSVTTKDIAHNISAAAEGTQEMAGNINQAAEVTHDVAQDISFVNSNSMDIKNVNTSVMENATTLSTISDSLSNLMSKFKLN